MVQNWISITGSLEDLNLSDEDSLFAQTPDNDIHSIEEGCLIQELIVASKISGLPIDYLEHITSHLPSGSRPAVLSLFCGLSEADVLAVRSSFQLRGFRLPNVG